MNLDSFFIKPPDNTIIAPNSPAQLFHTCFMIRKGATGRSTPAKPAFRLQIDALSIKKQGHNDAIRTGKKSSTYDVCLGRVTLRDTKHLSGATFVLKSYSGIKNGSRWVA
jgi:hypothetical protein